MKAVIYRDLKHENRHGYQLEEITSDSISVKEQVIPGMYGLQPVYIRHMHLHYVGKSIPIVSQTDYDLSAEKRLEILAGALELLEKEYTA